MGAHDLAHTIVESGTLLLASTDEREAIDVASKALRPHHLVVRDGRLDARLWQVPLGEQSATRLSYGAVVTVLPGDTDPDDYLLSIPITGEALVRHHGREVVATPTQAVIVGPDRDFRYDLDAACDQIVLRLPRRQVESVASTLTGGTGPVAFDLEVAGHVPGPQSEGDDQPHSGAAADQQCAPVDLQLAYWALSARRSILPVPRRGNGASAKIMRSGILNFASRPSRKARRPSSLSVSPFL